MVKRITLVLALLGCGGNSIDDCNALLARSDVPGAADCFAHVDNPQGKFGYGLTRLILWPNQPPMQQMMAKLRQPAWDPATRLFGPSGWLHDVMQNWSGTAALSLNGSPMALDRVRAGTYPDGSGTIYARSTNDSHLRVTIFYMPGSAQVDVEGPTVSTFGSGTAQVVQSNGRLTGPVDFMLSNGTRLTGTVDAPLSSCTRFEDRVPFQNLRGHYWDNGLLQALNDAEPGTTLAAVFDSLAATAPYLDDVAKALESAAAAPDFQFTIPKGLFFGAHDIEMRAADAALLAAFVRLIQFSVVFLDAYDWQINGSNLQSLTDSLNAHFFNVADASKLGDSLHGYAGVVSDAYGFIDAMGTPAPANGLADWSRVDSAGRDFLRNLVGFVQAGAQQNTTIPNTVPQTDLDISGIFGARPIDGKPLNFDPFVYDAPSATIVGVEGFWRDLLAGRFTPDFIGAMTAAPAFPSPNPLAGSSVTMPEPTRAQLELFTTAGSLGCN